ncbi:MAG: hypothetical protein NC206_05375 [Bacteroides sp.]|nr:hypothetical protein [Roseburia sp.]MCM1346496.1 hypothetical protein [Bacteroides sp.]MCM1421048.1 hypothetical protein [Bacteroides sp.]
MNKSMILAFTLSGLFSCMASAQVKPFVEHGKSWHIRSYNSGTLVLGTYNDGPSADYDLCFMDDADTLVDGRKYMRLTYQNGSYRDGHGFPHKDGEVYAILREEDGKVWQYDEHAKRDILLYDFTLSEGDEFELQAWQETETYACKVEKVMYTEINGTRLKQILFSSLYSDPQRDDEEDDTVYTIWTESIGGNTPVCQPEKSTLLSEGGSLELVPYIAYSDGRYMPQQYDYFNLHGQQLVLGKEVTADIPEDRCGHDDLRYEFTDERTLRVSGTIWTERVPNQYIYCVCAQEEGASCYEVRFEKAVPGQHTNELGAYSVDLSFTGFDAILPSTATFKIIDSEGTHIVEYGKGGVSPFLVEGKRWNCFYPNGSGLPGQTLHTFCIEGDTLVAGRECKKMYCYNDEDRVAATHLAAVLYEDGGKVFAVKPGEETGLLLYDFGAKVGDVCYVYECRVDRDGEVTYGESPVEITVTDRDEFVGDDGTVVPVIGFDAKDSNGYTYQDRWYEGIGTLVCPLSPCTALEAGGVCMSLLRCTAGTDVVYETTPYMGGMFEGQPVWTYYTVMQGADGEDDVEVTFTKFYLDGTVESNGKTYHKMYSVKSSEEGSVTAPEYLLGIREEGGRVYVDCEEYLRMSGAVCERLPYEQTEDGELVLYDFNMSESDRITWKMPDEAETYYEVAGKRPVNMQDKRIRYACDLSGEYCQPLEIIANIGCTNSRGLLLNYIDVMEHPGVEIGSHLNMYVMTEPGWTIYKASEYAGDPSEERHAVGCYKTDPFFDSKVGIELVREECTDSNDAVVYDLTGRRLSGKPLRGLYIRDGKKYIAH